MRPTAAPETSSENSPRTPCKIPKTKNQYSFHGESLKSRSDNVLLNASLTLQDLQVVKLEGEGVAYW